MLVARGILVKVNSVLIPGVNDEHLKEVSRVVKAKGAFLHNVMPLIAEAEHGTFYGVMGQRSPAPEELQDLQDACAGDMNMMRHCRQCRADAVGLLGEDRGEEFSLDRIEAMDIDYEAAMVKRAAVHAAIKDELDEKAAKKARLAAMSVPATDEAPARRYRPVLMAVATSGGGLVNQHYGHASEFLVYEASANGVRFIGNRKVDQYCVGNDSCGEQEKDAEGQARAVQGRVQVCLDYVRHFDGQGNESQGCGEAKSKVTSGHHGSRLFTSVWSWLCDSGGWLAGALCGGAGVSSGRTKPTPQRMRTVTTTMA